MPIWTPPITYGEQTIVSKDVLNEQFSENLRHLFARPLDVLTLGGGGTYLTASTTYSKVADLFEVEITTQATSTHLIWLNAMTRQTGSIYGETMFDVYDVVETELISNDKHGSASGLSRMGTRYSASTYRTQVFQYIYPDRPAGTYRYDLYWKDDGSGGSSELNLDGLCQFGVREI